MVVSFVQYVPDATFMYGLVYGLNISVIQKIETSN